MGSTPAHPTAILEIFSENKGILIPRMTAVQRQAIVSPATGLVVFQLDGTKGLWYFDGLKWRNEVQKLGLFNKKTIEKPKEEIPVLSI